MKLYTRPGKMTPKKLNEMRRQMILTMWQDRKLFGYTTESVKMLQKQIQRAKAK